MGWFRDVLDSRPATPILANDELRRSRQAVAMNGKINTPTFISPS